MIFDQDLVYLGLAFVDDRLFFQQFGFQSVDFGVFGRQGVLEVFEGQKVGTGDLGHLGVIMGVGQKGFYVYFRV